MSLLDELQKMLVGKLATSEAVASAPPAPTGDPWAAPPAIHNQTLSQGETGFPAWLQPNSGQSQQAAMGQGPKPAGDASFMDQMLKMVNHPLAQMAMGGIAGAAAQPRFAGTARRIGGGFFGGLQGLDQGRRMQLYEEEQQDRTKDREQMRTIQQGHLDLSKEQLAEQKKQHGISASLQGLQSPESATAFRGQMDPNDPIAQKAMKLVPQDSPTFARDFQQVYGFLQSQDQKQQLLIDKLDMQEKLAGEKRQLEQAKLEIMKQGQTLTHQVQMQRVDLALARVNLELSGLTQRNQLEQQKIQETNKRFIESRVGEFTRSTLMLMEPDQNKRNEMINAYRQQLEQSISTTGPTPAGPTQPTPQRGTGIGPQPVAPTPGSTQPPQATGRYNPATGLVEPIRR